MKLKKGISKNKKRKYLYLSLAMFSTVFLAEGIYTKHDIENKSHYTYALELGEDCSILKSNTLNLVDRNKNCKKDPKQVEQVILKLKYPVLNTCYIKSGKSFVVNCNDFHVIANKKRNLPSSYEPKDLVPINIRFSKISFNKENMLRKKAATMVEELVNDAKKQGMYYKGVSAYRSYENQVFTYSYIAKNKGYAYADKYSARPGQSEHQTGLSIDLGIKSMGYDLNQNFAKTKEGKWLKENCSKYGFIIRYPEDKTYITGYSFEPWHIRYVGKELATYLTDNDLTLEEFYGMY